MIRKYFYIILFLAAVIYLNRGISYASGSDADSKQVSITTFEDCHTGKCYYEFSTEVCDKENCKYEYYEDCAKEVTETELPESCELRYVAQYSQDGKLTEERFYHEAARNIEFVKVDHDDGYFESFQRNGKPHGIWRSYDQRQL